MAPSKPPGEAQHCKPLLTIAIGPIVRFFDRRLHARHRAGAKSRSGAPRAESIRGRELSLALAMESTVMIWRGKQPLDTADGALRVKVAQRHIKAAEIPMAFPTRSASDC
jgi:hypothetical protein